jgi:hypothetical protein
VIEILPSEWSLVIAHEARFDVLRAAAAGGAAAVRAILVDLENRPPGRSDYFTEGRFAPPPMTTYETAAGRAVYVE